MTNDLTRDDLVERLDEGVVQRARRWSGDTHTDLGGSADEDATDALMKKAARRIEALQAEVEKWRIAAADEATRHAMTEDVLKADADRRVEEEREACAEIAEDYDGFGVEPREMAQLGDAHRTASDIAAAIHSRSNGEASIQDTDDVTASPISQAQCSIEPSALSEEQLAHEARFLIDRLRELDWSDLDVTFRDFCGHVEPSISRLEGALDRRAQRKASAVSEPDQTHIESASAIRSRSNDAQPLDIDAARPRDGSAIGCADEVQEWADKRAAFIRGLLGR